MELELIFLRPGRTLRKSEWRLVFEHDAGHLRAPDAYVGYTVREAAIYWRHGKWADFRSNRLWMAEDLSQ